MKQGTTVAEQPGILEILKMDGRKRAPVLPLFSRYPWASVPAVSSVKVAIQSFEQSGSSNHSGARTLLPYIIAYCEAKGYSYELSCAFTGSGKCAGYFIKKIPNL